MSICNQQRQYSDATHRIWFQLYDYDTGMPYNQTRASKISLPPFADLADFCDAVKAKCPNQLSSTDAVNLSVFKNKDAFDKREADEGREEPLKENLDLASLGTCLSDALIVSLKGQKESKNLILGSGQVDIVSSSLKKWLSDDLAAKIKKQGGNISKPLLDTSGSDFLFSDREESFEWLLINTRKRYYNWMYNFKDKTDHAIPVLHGGRGSGKSRFLQELSVSFKDYVQKSDSFDDFKTAFNDALFINISFGNLTPYTDEDDYMGIEKAISLRILEQADRDNGRAVAVQFDAFSEKENILPFTFRKVCGDEYRCLVLGIDETNKVYEHNIKAFEDLFKVIGRLSCTSSVLFVPVLAGTAIGPTEKLCSNSKQPFCMLPLIPLSLEASKNILKQKIPELETGDAKFIQMVSDVGGHARLLEYLYDVLVSPDYNRDTEDYWATVGSAVRSRITDAYQVNHPALGNAIAYSFLSLSVEGKQKVFGDTTFYDLEEAGLIQLKRISWKYLVKIPFMFVWCHLQRITDGHYKFWYHILVGEKIGWQEWDVFNRNYIAFRVSLYNFLDYKQVPIREFFKGAIYNLPEDMKVQIPTLKQIEIEYFQHSNNRNISDKLPSSSWTFYLNCVDTLSWLETSEYISLKGILFVGRQLIQMNETPPFDLKFFNTEYQKINDAVPKNLPDMVFIMFSRSGGNFKKSTLPSKAVLVSNSELLAFFGESYFQRLKNE